jgi:small conductance mechanosensitive channel
MTKLRQRLATIPNVLLDPAPSVELLEFSPLGPVLAVRPFCHNDNYWSVYFATNQAIAEEFSKAGYPVAEQHHFMRSVRGAS